MERLYRTYVHFSPPVNGRAVKFSQREPVYPLISGLLSSEHVVSDGPAINGRPQSERTLKRLRTHSGFSLLQVVRTGD